MSGAGGGGGAGKKRKRARIMPTLVEASTRETANTDTDADPRQVYGHARARVRARTSILAAARAQAMRARAQAKTKVEVACTSLCTRLARDLGVCMDEGIPFPLLHAYLDTIHALSVAVIHARSTDTDDHGAGALGDRCGTADDLSTGASGWQGEVCLGLIDLVVRHAIPQPTVIKKVCNNALCCRR